MSDRFVRVPREPTPEMCSAFFAALKPKGLHTPGWLDIGYTAMLSAAPSPPEGDTSEIDRRALWGVVANARRNARTTAKRAMLWSLVMGATALGSTSSAALCRRMGFDPDSTSEATDKLTTHGHGGGEGR